MGLALLERLTYDAWNFVYSFVGYPTTLPWILFVLFAHNKILYVIFGVICAAFFGYTVYLYFTGAAGKSVETQASGDSGPTYDYYWMCMIITGIYMFICVMGFLHPDEVAAHRNSAIERGRSGSSDGGLGGLGKMGFGKMGMGLAAAGTAAYAASKAKAAAHAAKEKLVAAKDKVKEKAHAAKEKVKEKWGALKGRFSRHKAPAAAAADAKEPAASE